MEISSKILSEMRSQTKIKRSEITLLYEIDLYDVWTPVL